MPQLLYAIPFALEDRELFADFPVAMNRGHRRPPMDSR